MMTIKLADFGGETPLEQLRNALAGLREHPGATLTIPPGVYLLGDDAAARLQQEVMTGKYSDNPHMTMFNRRFVYTSALDFSGLCDVTIDAEGAVFLIDGMMCTLELGNCSGVTVRGLTIDMRRRAYSQGRIVRCDADSFDVRFVEREWISAQMPAPRMCIFEQGCSRLLGVLNAELRSEARKELLDEQTVRFFRAVDPAWEEQDIYVCHTWHSCPAVRIYQSSGITLEGVRIHSHGGMGIVGHRSRDITLRHCMVVPAPGKAVSTNTDATHFASCQGLLRCEHCFFEGHGDDAINVHGYYQTVTGRQDGGYLLRVNVLTSIHSLRMDHPDVGDTVEFVRRKNLAAAGRYRVTAVRLDPEQGQCVVELDRPLPDDCIGEFLCDITQLPRFEFIGCHVGNHVARGVMLRTRGALIEGCSFDGSSGVAIQISVECFWNESAASEDVVVRNNRMVRCGFMESPRTSGIAVLVGADELPDRPVHRRIVLEDNLIACVPGCKAIRATFAEDITIRNNRTDGEIVTDNCVNLILA